MRLFTDMSRKPLVGAAFSLPPILLRPALVLPALLRPVFRLPLFLRPALLLSALLLSAWWPAPAAAQPVAVPSVVLPAAFRNAPPDAQAQAAPNPVFSDPDLARLIDAARRHSPAHAPLRARLSSLGSGSAAAIEKRFLEAELARLDHQVAEEVAHAWQDARAASARTALAAGLEHLARETAELVRQRLDAGLAIRTELDQETERAHKISTLVQRFAQEKNVALTRLLTLTAETVLPPAAAQAPVTTTAASTATSTAPPAAPIRAATPSLLLQRPDVRAARVRLDSREAGAAELQAGYREVLLKALEEAEAAYAAAVTARGLRAAALPLAASAQRQTAALKEQLDAGRIGKAQWLEAQAAEQRARLSVLDADHAYARALVTLERALGHAGSQD